MGHTIWVEVRGRPLEETADDSSTMHRLMDKLDALATRLEVPKLSDFYDYSALERAYGGLDDEGDSESDVSEDEAPADEPPPPTLDERQAEGEWFDSAEGLKSIRALRTRLSERFEDLGFTPDRSTDHWPEQLMNELAHSESVIQDAVATGRRFRLLIVP